MLMQSRKPIAKAFKKEVKKILKEIRLYGGYIHTTGKESDEEIIAKALKIARNTLGSRSEFIQCIE